MTQLPNMSSYFNDDLMISIMAPEGWDGEIESQDEFRIFSPEEPEFDNYRSTISFQRGQPEGIGMDWFEQVTEESLQDMQATYNEFKLLGEDRYLLTGMEPAYVRWYEWRDVDTNLHFSQVQCLIYGQYMYVVNAATLKPTEDKYMPIFNAMIKSIRIIPERT